MGSGKVLQANGTPTKHTIQATVNAQSVRKTQNELEHCMLLTHLLKNSRCRDCSTTQSPDSQFGTVCQEVPLIPSIISMGSRRALNMDIPLQLTTFPQHILDIGSEGMRLHSVLPGWNYLGSSEEKKRNYNSFPKTVQSPKLLDYKTECLCIWVST